MVENKRGGYKMSTLSIYKQEILKAMQSMRFVSAILAFCVVGGL